MAMTQINPEQIRGLDEFVRGIVREELEKHDGEHKDK